MLTECISIAVTYVESNLREGYTAYTALRKRERKIVTEHRESCTTFSF